MSFSTWQWRYLGKWILAASLLFLWQTFFFFASSWNSQSEKSFLSPPSCCFDFDFLVHQLA